MILVPVGAARGGSSASPKVEADCLASDDVQDVVRISGPPVGGVLQVTKLNIDAPGTDMAVGVLVNKATPTRCTVQLDGTLSGIYTGLTAGRPLFVSPSGRLTHSAPVPPMVGMRSVYPAAVALDDNTIVLRFGQPTRIRA